jgi:predicted transcriptional regulator
MRTKNELSPEQLMAVEMIVCKRGAGIKYSEIASSVGVSERTLLRWRQNPEFREEVRRRTLELNGEHLPRVLEALVKRALAGNVKAVELYLKVENLLNQGKEQPEPVLEKRPTNEELEREIAELEKQLGISDDGRERDYNVC